MTDFEFSDVFISVNIHIPNFSLMHAIPELPSVSSSVSASVFPFPVCLFVAPFPSIHQTIVKHMSPIAMIISIFKLSNVELTFRGLGYTAMFKANTIQVPIL